MLHSMKNLIQFDWAMKKLLHDKANYTVLEGFLSELFNCDVAILQMEESDSNSSLDDEKLNRVDILAYTSKDEITLIEFQFDGELDYLNRMICGVSKSVAEHLKVWESYGKIKKVYSVNITYHGGGRGTDYVYHGKTEFRGLHNQDLLALNFNQIEQHKVKSVYEIYPEYYILKINDFENEVKTSLDEWMYYFKNTDIKDSFNAKGLDLVKQKLTIDVLSESEYLEYKKFRKSKDTEITMLQVARYEGQQEGIEKGKMEIAKNLLNLGVKTKDIASATGLSIDIISQLKHSTETILQDY